MSDTHPDPLADTFRHANTHAQGVVTGLARGGEAKAARAERQARQQAAAERAAREQVRLQTNLTRTVNDTARDDIAAGTRDQTARTGELQAEEVTARTLSDAVTRPVDAAPSPSTPDSPTAEQAPVQEAATTRRNADAELG